MSGLAAFVVTLVLQQGPGFAASAPSVQRTPQGRATEQAMGNQSGFGVGTANVGADSADGGPVPAPDLKPEEGADLSPLPAGALVRYQVLSLMKGCRGNLRFVLYDDGRFFVQRNVRGDCPYPQRFDAPLPAGPSRTLAAADMAAIRAVVAAQRVDTLADGYRPQRGVDDGAEEILEVVLAPGRVKRIVAMQVEHPAINAIRDRILVAAR